MSDAIEVTVTDIGEYVRHHSCQRRFKLKLMSRSPDWLAHFPLTEGDFDGMDPVLATVGKGAEEQWAESLERQGFIELEPPQTPEDEAWGVSWDRFVRAASTLPVGQPAFAREVRIKGEIGAFALRGRIDFILLQWEHGLPVMHLIECKASRRDRTYHRIQVILYQILMRARLEGEPLFVGGVMLDPDTLECSVARIDAETNRIQPMLELEGFEHTHVYEADVRHLLDKGGVLEGIVHRDLDALPYQLEPKCDVCKYSPHCFKYSVDGRRLELLGLSPSQCQALAAHHIHSLDDLATLESNGSMADALRRDPTFVADIDGLIRRANARRAQLDALGDDLPPATPRSRASSGHLPAHEQQGSRLVRVYLSIQTDYAENRIFALAAHITTSEGRIETPFEHLADGTLQPVPRTVERLTNAMRMASGGNTHRGVQGTNIVELQRIPWTGDTSLDTHAERLLLQGFFRRLQDAIQLEASDASAASVHFYVWSRGELSQLLEGCNRAGQGLLRGIRHLFGCREQLEQLIYSSIQAEYLQRFAPAWTGSGLVTATATSWSGRRYHWTRRVGRRDIDLSATFHHGVFDFAQEDTRAGGATLEERRSRFYDNLPVGYFRSYWGTLDLLLEGDEEGRYRDAVSQYEGVKQPLVLEHYLIARVHALRFLEEQIEPKNEDITKPPIDLTDLELFRLGTTNAAEASVDFLKLDHHVAFGDWLQRHLLPPLLRVHQGHSLIVRDLRCPNNASTSVAGIIDTTDAKIDLAALRSKVSFEEGSFVRLTPMAGESFQSQRINELLEEGRTCVVDTIDWQTGEVFLSVIPRSRNPRPEHRYIVPSKTFYKGSIFSRGTLDASISDYTSGRVEKRLSPERQGGELKGAHAISWFDPISPSIPVRDKPTDTVLIRAKEVLDALRLGGKHPVGGRRQEIILEGLSTRVQLVQGPPGTGKTMLAAVAILTRILVNRTSGDVVLIASHTHMAVDTLLDRILAVLPDFQRACAETGAVLPEIKVAKVHSSGGEDEGDIHAVSARSCKKRLDELAEEAVVIAGGTTGSMLKMVDEGLNPTATYAAREDGFQTPLLIVDEASMLVASNFLALATLVSKDGAIMLAGDHRQLSPIVAHDWAREDRPPAMAYQPHLSAFEAIVNLAEKLGDRMEGCISRSGLQVTYRLPPAIRSLISPVYELDDIKLGGPESEMIWGLPPKPEEDDWGVVWTGGRSLFLAVHSEHDSTDQNALELDIIEAIFNAGGEDIIPDSVAIVTPYRAQRASARTRFEDRAGVALIDTVERLQGGERPTIIFTTAISDPVAVAKSADFILDLNRSNVAFSRPQERLIVVCSRALLDHIPTEVESYNNAVVWKYLRQVCDLEVGAFEIAGHKVELMASRGDI